MGTNERNIKQLYWDFYELIEGVEENESPALSVSEFNQIREIVENRLKELEHRNGVLSEHERFFETLLTSALYAFSAGYMTAYNESTEDESAEDESTEDESTEDDT